MGTPIADVHRTSPTITVMILLLFFLLPDATISATIGALNRSESLRVNDTLVSPNGRFLLSFSTLPHSPNRHYLALKHTGVPDMLWIANRDNPINSSSSSSATLTLSEDGILALYQNNTPVHVLYKPNRTIPLSLHLLDTGNLVLRDVPDRTSTLWQSFDHPTDSLLPAMKLSLDLRTNQTRTLSSWTSPDDPSIGDVSYALRQGPLGSYEMYLASSNGTIYYRPGPWNGAGFSRTFKHSFVITKEEVSYSYEATTSSAAATISRMVAKPQGVVVQQEWDPQRKSWKELWKGPSEECDF